MQQQEQSPHPSKEDPETLKIKAREWRDTAVVFLALILLLLGFLIGFQGQMRSLCTTYCAENGYDAIDTGVFGSGCTCIRFNTPLYERWGQMQNSSTKYLNSNTNSFEGVKDEGDPG